ncbi:MAG TPA: 3-hydroxyacyl-CoA dehydrogenase, partial [Rhodobacteraceae bacterium]|nr:3-hydroxyacyl-CoA dehydrogenase [Paracoccaceae bacterium]
MAYTNFNFETDADGIALITWDTPDKSMNVLTEAALREFAAIVDQLAADDAVKGAIIASGKKNSFAGGADLAMLENLVATGRKLEREKGLEAASAHVLENGGAFARIIRKMETCGKPVAAAINGTCMGGGYEISLGCHYRLAARHASARIGLPEAKVGLFPGGGGSQRLPRLIGASDALQLMLQGRTLRFDQALKMGMIDKIVPASRLLGEAKKWLKTVGDPVARWDRKGYRIPGGLPYSKNGMMTFTAANAIYRRETMDNYPALRALMSCVYEGLLVDIDTGLKIEARYFAHILRTPEAQNMIRTLFLSMQALGKGARRPASVPPTRIRKLGVLGAGMMGAGIAHVSAQAGIKVVLLDRDMAAAEKGKAHAEKLISRRVMKGRASARDRERLLDRITPTANYDDLKGCDLVIEAVFEDRQIKAAVTKEAEARLGRRAVFGSNTSTLPITSLARASSRPAHFIGIHFFSPVEKMRLVEIIMGKQTGDLALAKALDFVRAIGKTPIVVNDSRGFFTSRVVGTYISEGISLLTEGVPAAMVENVARMAGMPVGPLALNDEVGL